MPLIILGGFAGAWLVHAFHTAVAHQAHEERIRALEEKTDKK